jgi:hypothetical protein
VLPRLFARATLVESGALTSSVGRFAASGGRGLLEELMKRRLILLTLLSSIACGDDDGPPVDGGGTDAADVDASIDSGNDDGSTPACLPRDPSSIPDPGECTPESDDYVVCSDTDGWDACVSDGGEYVRIQESVSTIARIRAFDQIATLLFDPATDPSADDFLEARGLYQEDEGLDSRVVRRYDVDVDAPPGTDCTLEGVPAMYPEYCIGPSTLQPTLLDAFTRGAMDEAPTRLQAARIEGALLRFLVVSVTKEALTCTATARDCDSSYAYYAGGSSARGAEGLARYVEAADPYAHDRVWDGIFALRCWRDLDSADTATNTALRDRARDQQRRALIDGVAAVVASRLRDVETTSDLAQDYHWTFLRNFAPVLVPYYAERDASGATALEAALEGEAAPEDPGALADAIEAAFDCP